MELVKAVPMGFILTWVLALIIGSTGSGGGQLAIHQMTMGEIQFLWSWPLFLGGTGLAWGLMLMQR